jgi:hypothetical protein
VLSYLSPCNYSLFWDFKKERLTRKKVKVFFPRKEGWWGKVWLRRSKYSANAKKSLKRNEKGIEITV